MFESQAELIVQAAGKLNRIFLTTDPDLHVELFKEIKDLENQGDDVASISLMNLTKLLSRPLTGKTFIT